MEKTFVVNEVRVVIVVEGGWSLEVQRRQVVVAGARGAGAVGLQWCGEGAVDVGVIVDVGSKAGAPGLANGMSTYVE